MISLVESQNPVVTQLTDPVNHAEGPFWDDVDQKLFYVDIYEKTVHRLDPVTMQEEVLQLDQTPSFVIPIEGREDQFILSLDRDLVLLTWNFQTGFYSICHLLTVDNDRPGNRFNEAKADALGRLWAGSKGAVDENYILLSPDEAALYRIDMRQPQEIFADLVLAPVSISNGLVWSPDNKFLYYIDSPSRQVDVFSFDHTLGNISGRKVLFSFEDNELQGIPDGLNIDSDGNLYVTLNGGGQIVKFDPITGDVLQKIHIPVRHVTSVEFGGPNLEILFVTTMKSKTMGLAPEPEAGAVFTVTGLNVTGLPSNRAVFNSVCNDIRNENVTPISL